MYNPIAGKIVDAKKERLNDKRPREPRGQERERRKEEKEKEAVVVKGTPAQRPLLSAKPPGAKSTGFLLGVDPLIYDYCDKHGFGVRSLSL